ncbi:hypothetical protein [Acidiphilium acidophilum]|uniref:hypothetical protein n=1 Tax=Acidiphilium acidophilum TaxID=76588 RepID=UPI00386FA571
MQRSFAEYDGFRKQRKFTRRDVFLAEMERVLPWRRLEALIELSVSLKGSASIRVIRVDFEGHHSRAE